MPLPDILILAGVALWLATSVIAWFSWRNLRQRTIAAKKLSAKDYQRFTIKMTGLGLCFTAGCALIAFGLIGTRYGQPNLSDNSFYLLLCTGSGAGLWLLLILYLSIMARLIPSIYKNRESNPS